MAQNAHICEDNVRYVKEEVMRPERQSDPVSNRRGKADNGLMTFKEIAKRMGLADAASAHFIYNRAMWKLRTRYATRQHEITDLYSNDPDFVPQKVRPNDVIKISDLDESRFPLQPRNCFPNRGK